MKLVNGVGYIAKENPIAHEYRLACSVVVCTTKHLCGVCSRVKRDSIACEVSFICYFIIISEGKTEIELVRHVLIKNNQITTVHVLHVTLFNGKMKVANTILGINEHARTIFLSRRLSAVCD